MTSDTSELLAGTFRHEDGLPRVPLPTLEESGQRLLEWCTPLLDADELATTRAAVTAFLEADSPAHLLQGALEKYDTEPGVHSWLDRFWPSRYLGRRDRVALDANFCFLFNPAPGEGQLQRAAGLVTAALDYKLQLDQETLAPATQRGQVTTMVQNKSLFSATRIPHRTQDTVRAPYTDDWPGPSTARHIVVFFRGNAFRMDVLGPSGRPHTLEELVAGLEAVREEGAARAAAGTAVGQLTTKARADWADSRQRLLTLDPANAEALDVVETALFCLCLDDLTPKDDHHACDQLLHGDSTNRWFDKAVSLIVLADGTAGINVEHCRLDGTTIIQLIDAMLNEPAEVHAQRSGAAPQGRPDLAPLRFVLDDDLCADVRAAGEAFSAYAAGTATTTLAFPGRGSNRIKELGVSPDAFVHMAMQLAHKRAKGLVGATYESIATRQYQHGRTEAMRVITPEILSFVAAMEDPDADQSTRTDALRAAADKHVARIKECQRGEAPEQHLWELKLIQERQGDELGATEPLALYDSPGWLKLRDDYLSTSSAPSLNIQFFAFGSTSTKCIGVAYLLLPDRLKFYMSTPRTVAAGMDRFAEELGRAIEEIDDLLAAPAPAPAPQPKPKP
jgi:carnitine O-acetyltransferase